MSVLDPIDSVVQSDRNTESKLETKCEMSSWKPVSQEEMKVIAGHVRRMIGTPDPFSILIRGMVLIDRAIEELIDAFSVLPFKRIASVFDNPSLFQKANLACSLGAISEGELACLAAINSLRNKVAHRLSVSIDQTDEARIVEVFQSQTRLFRGMKYNPSAFPIALVFLLLVTFYMLSLRSGRPETKIAHVGDENIESVRAITLTTSIVKIVKQNADADDDKIIEILRTESDAAMKFVQEHQDADEPSDLI